MFRCASIVLGICVAAIVLVSDHSTAAETVVYGAHTFQRNTGKPVALTQTFQVSSPAPRYTLRVINNGVTNAEIALNGVRIISAADFVNAPTRIERAVVVANGTNSITVELRGAPRTSLTVDIFTTSGDTVPPTISATASPPPNANGWNQTNVTVSFTCSDAGSGIASCPAPFTVTTEGAHQAVSGTATDTAGNSASTTVFVSLDKTPPVVAAAPSPAANANGWNNSSVKVTFVASDTVSGVAPGTLTAPITLSSDGANLSVSGQATDLAGNVGTTTRAGINIDLTQPTMVVALTPAANDNGWYNGPVSAHFTCADAGSGVEGCPPDEVVLAEGTHTVSATVTDKAGNTRSVTSDAVRIDLGTPSIAAVLTPPPNSHGWNSTPVTVHFTCSDAGAGIATCPPDQVVSSDGANQTITGTAIDRAGNIAVAFANVSLDRGAPTLSFTAPLDGATLLTPNVTLAGTVGDAIAGIAAVTCNGAPAVVTGGTISCDVTLAKGPNSIVAVATDLAGNVSSTTLGLTYTRVPVVTITSPAAGDYLNISPTTVTGVVDDPTAMVMINSVAAGTANGSFSVALPLAEGPNVITAIATSPDGPAGTASVSVTLDTTPPHVTITSPPDQFVTTQESISVAGIVNDIVVGTVNDEQAHVTVNGGAASVANRTFLSTTVPLAAGVNVIQAIGTDRVGNSATTQIIVTRRASTGPQIRTVSGNNQSAAIGSLVPAPLVVELSDGLGNPVPNGQVVFKVTDNDGLVAAGGSSGPSVIVPTDGQGRASGLWTLGHRAGAGGNTVEAYAVGFDGLALFTASGTQGTPAKIVVDAGTDQIGLVGESLPKPFIAVVVDAGNNRLGGVPVTFNVVQGGGSFGGQGNTVVVTDSDGRAEATLTLGLQEGNANNFAQANFASNGGFAAGFAASGRAPGNPAATTITGVVLDNSNTPIPGVTVRAVLTNVLHSNLAAVQTAPSAETDAQGQFTIVQSPVGFVKLLVDGSTAQLSGTYPSLEYDMVTIPGQSNTVGQPIYLLALNAANQLCVTSTTGGGTLTIPEAPGFSLTFTPGQVTFPGGSQTGCVSVTMVHGDKVPMVPGFGQQPRFIVTIQPAGAVFNPPAAITLPNVDGLAPREVTEMYSFDHDIGSFVAIGTGIVSDDGLIIRSSPGVGVLKAGWHCGGNPSPTGAAADCPVCKICQTDHCEADPSQNGQTLPDNKCKICKNGSATDIDLNETGVEAEFTFGPPAPAVDKLNEALEELKSIGIIAKANLLQVKGKIETKQCCEPENGKGAGNEVTGTVTADFGSFSIFGKVWPLGPIPRIKITVDIFGVASIEAKGEFIGGVFIGGEAKVTGEVGYRKKDCAKDPADQSGCLFGKLEIGITPTIKAEIGGEASITYDCFFCDKTTIAAAASFVAGNLSWPISIAGVQYNGESCSSGLTGGFLKPGDLKFKVSVTFSGSVKTDAIGFKEFKETFNFVDCTIPLSGSPSCTFGF